MGGFTFQPSLPGPLSSVSDLPMRALAWMCCLAFVLGGCKSRQSDFDLEIVMYDSLGGESGFGTKVIQNFEKECQCKIKKTLVSDASQINSHLHLLQQSSRPLPHLVMGHDQHLWLNLKEVVNLKADWNPKAWPLIPPHLKVEDGFFPFDYSVFSFVADENKLKHCGLEKPKSLTDLLKPEWKKKFIIQDPRSSSPGYGFLMTSKQIMGDEWLSFWKSLKGQWLTMTSSWDQAYALFLEGEAPLVWSYISSEAYHIHEGDLMKKAIPFEQGSALQIEGISIVDSPTLTPQALVLAQDFIDFVLSPSTQSLIPETQWMFPVLPTTLPPSFSRLSMPASETLKSTPTKPDEILKLWRENLSL
jgi:thiamine transport system substrate-binding protein